MEYIENRAFKWVALIGFWIKIIFYLFLQFAPGLGIRSFDFRAKRSFFVQKWVNERFICSFLVSDLSDSLMIGHFLWATLANCSWLLIFGERNERFAHITHLIWAKWAFQSHCSQKKRIWAKMSDSLIFLKFFILITLYKT